MGGTHSNVAQGGCQAIRTRVSGSNADVFEPCICV